MTDMEIETFLTVLRSGSMPPPPRRFISPSLPFPPGSRPWRTRWGRRCLSGARACGGWS